MYAFIRCGLTTHLFQDSNILKLPNKVSLKNYILKACVRYFLSNFHFSPNDTLQKLWKMFFISSKKPFSLLRYSNSCIFAFPYFFLVSHWFRGWSNEDLKICNVINCLNKSLTLFRRGEVAKRLPNQFFPATSTNVGISP